MDNALVLIVEDEPQIAEILEAYLARDGFRTVTARDGETALQHHARLSPDLVLLDVKLPKMDGFAVLARLRAAGDTPVIMVTALGEDLDKLASLRIGADDHVVKPFNPLEVVARARAVLRRTHSRGGGEGARRLRVAGLEVDLTAHAARICPDGGDGGYGGDGAKGAPVALDLTLTEFRLLAHMARHPTRAFTRGELLDACLPEEGEALERTVDSHLSKLRRKLETAGATGFVESVRGVGYRLRSP
ncbi:MAG: hypothetical protein RLY86_1559 [Pseudomonadota bacterium]|jgi:two-component system response regulator AdeR